MDKIISFGKGIRRQPSIGEDGELSELVNLIPKNGELANVRGMEKIDNITLSENLEYIGVMHVSSISDVHFAKYGKWLYYIFVDPESDAVDFNDAKELYCVDDIEKCVIMGKCLIAYCPYAKYFIVRGESMVEFDDYIGDINITFGLKGTLYKELEESVLEFTLPNISNDTSDYNTASRTYLERVGEQISSSVHRRELEGVFVNPFMVRYAYRMYDGSIKCISSPVYMPCCNKYGAVGIYRYNANKVDAGTQFTYKTRVAFYENELYYMLTESVDFAALSDIVLGINIYVCPIHMVSSATSEYISKDELGSYFNFSAENTAFYFKKRSIDHESNYEYVASWDKTNAYSEIKECSTFFLLDKVAVDDLKIHQYKKVKGKAIEALLTSEVLEEELSDSFRYAPNVVTSYNDRVILGGIKRRVKTNNKMSKSASCTKNGSTDYNNTEYGIQVVCEKDSNEYAADIYRQDEIISNAYIPYLFIPISWAKELIISNGTNCVIHKLYRHPFLNGTYAFAENLGNLLDNMNSAIPSIEMSSDDVDVMHNSILISEAGKPFVYKSINEVAVGSGRIIGLSTGAKALSEGQFGQFPLIAFCTDGIWALEINADGTFKSVQPISRDVCNNPYSITQIDGAVAFTTDQGLKLIQGSEVVLLSGHMDGHNVKENDYFPAGFFASFGKEGYDSLVVDESRDMRDILKTCKIAYDYTNQMLRIFPERDDSDTRPYKYYVYSFATNEFATVISNEGAVDNVVADYPSSIVQIGNILYHPMEHSRVDKDGNLIQQKGLLLTRPIDMGEPFALKKLHDMRMHYTKHGKDSKCHVVVYVSNDGVRWAMLRSLRHSSYKYYRLAVITNLTDDDRLSGLVMRYEVERNNKLR